MKDLEGMHSLLIRDRHRRFLRMASMVCSAWKDEAQPLLWADLVVEKEDRAQRIIESDAFGHYSTHEVLVMGHGEERHRTTSESAARLLLGLKNVRVLTLQDLTLDYEVLCSENLQGLRHLQISNVCLHLPPSLPYASLRFQLHTLNLNDFDFPIYILKSCTSQLKYLDIQGHLGSRNIDDLSEILKAATTLEEFDYADFFPSTLCDSFGSLLNLKRLSVSLSAENIACLGSALPPTGSRIVKAECDMRSNEDAFVDELRDAISKGRLSRFASIKGTFWDWDLRERPNRAAMVRELEAAGVEFM